MRAQKCNQCCYDVRSQFTYQYSELCVAFGPSFLSKYTSQKFIANLIAHPAFSFAECKIATYVFCLYYVCHSIYETWLTPSDLCLFITSVLIVIQITELQITEITEISGLSITRNPPKQYSAILPLTEFFGERS